MAGTLRASRAGARKTPQRRGLSGEDALQKSLVDFVRTVLPGVVVFAIPNGGKRTKAEAGILKATGVLAGVSDLEIWPDEIAPRSLFVEVKTDAGKLSVEQRSFGRRAAARGHYFVVWRSIDDARKTFAMMGVKTREARA
jgi:hypothetical protein